MNGFLSQGQVERIKKQYPVGTRIEMISMDDPYSPIEPGTQGTIDYVDDVGTLHCKFDNGRTLGVIPSEDSFKTIPKEQEQIQSQSMGGMSM